jgi:hypothetical protein
MKVISDLSKGDNFVVVLFRKGLAIEVAKKDTLSRLNCTTYKNRNTKVMQEFSDLVVSKGHILVVLWLRNIRLGRLGKGFLRSDDSAFGSC